MPAFTDNLYRSFVVFVVSGTCTGPACLFGLTFRNNSDFQRSVAPDSVASFHNALTIHGYSSHNLNYNKFKIC